MALRMGGEAPHLGIVLTEGSLSDYSVDRDVKKRSNDRGCFMLHPSPMEFAPGEEKRICWTIFPHEGKEDFFKCVEKLTRFVKVDADRYVLFKAETCRIKIAPSFDAVSVKVNGKEAANDGEGYYLFVDADDYGEKKLDICVDGIHTWCRLFVHEKPETLAARRCKFIAEKQQY